MFWGTNPLTSPPIMAISRTNSADELKLFRRREEDRFNFRHEFLVHSGHLEFVFKIADGAGPADDAG